MRVEIPAVELFVLIDFRSVRILVLKNVLGRMLKEHISQATFLFLLCLSVEN
jgi:hypothetical protein